MTQYNSQIESSCTAQKYWQSVPAPQRGELLRIFSNVLRDQKSVLAEQIVKDSRKIISEGEGEVQEMIDICDFALGLSRQMYGLTMPSERPNHRMQEIWHPIGVVGVISAFNFPMAVWAWNHALAIVCGNSVVWKPSPKAVGCAVMCKKAWDVACDIAGLPAHNLLMILDEDIAVSYLLAKDKRVALLSATGSTEMGKALAPQVAERLGRGLYELGGNNSMIVSQYANLELAKRAIVFSAVGTCGQRCTTLRRLIVHSSVYDKVLESIKSAYTKLVIGDPMDRKTLVGPLIGFDSLTRMQDVLNSCKSKGYIVTGGTPIPELGLGYVNPAIVEVTEQCELVQTETFAPILYVVKYDTLEEAIALQNGVTQGLSSCIFTDNVQESEIFISAAGSDCGIANINIGPSGAEIGGAFGGEKDTGGGRESGSDAWKTYMRRMTVTVNYGKDLPLAQGVQFDV
jgi:aldehyde dehydrogenase (NAD+)